MTLRMGLEEGYTPADEKEHMEDEAHNKAANLAQFICFNQVVTDCKSRRCHVSWLKNFDNLENYVINRI